MEWELFAPEKADVIFHVVVGLVAPSGRVVVCYDKRF
jgi:hypothetical protein